MFRLGKLLTPARSQVRESIEESCPETPLPHSHLRLVGLSARAPLLAFRAFDLTDKPTVELRAKSGFEGPGTSLVVRGYASSNSGVQSLAPSSRLSTPTSQRVRRYGTSCRLYLHRKEGVVTDSLMVDHSARRQTARLE